MTHHTESRHAGRRSEDATPSGEGLSKTDAISDASPDKSTYKKAADKYLKDLNK